MTPRVQPSPAGHEPERVRDILPRVLARLIPELVPCPACDARADDAPCADCQREIDAAHAELPGATP